MSTRIYYLLRLWKILRTKANPRRKDTFSGMIQKLGLASCLLSGKRLLILDEPMSGLDPRARILFKKQLAKLKRQGATVFFSSHVLADVEEIADTMAVLHNSHLRFTGSPEAFKQQYNGANVEQAYMKCIGNKVKS